MNIFPIKPCHMSKNMLHLPYGKERGMYANDGRRSGYIPEIARMEPVPAEARETRILLCSEVAQRGGLHCSSTSCISSDPRTSPFQATESRIIVLPAATEQIAQSFSGVKLSVLWLLLLVVYCTTMDNG